MRKQKTFPSPAARRTEEGADSAAAKSSYDKVRLEPTADVEKCAINDYNAIIDEWRTSWQA
ncbi:hypothetical protein [Rhizobium tubonense]|uniref:hypothetical protein n=1 Tax=Rhizobium tubonense TaxID=484088 RepID=UPI0018A857D6|nr:hypothetical protein [Rhizobium tubonense]